MTDPVALHAQAIAAFNRGDWPQVMKLGAALLPLAPDHAGVHYLVGIASLEQRNLLLALRHLQRATDLDPARVEFVAHLAKALSQARLTSAAKAAADRAMALMPADAGMLDLLGSIYAEANAHESATEAFRHAVMLSPDNPLYRYNLATALLNMGDIDAAEREIETCLTQDQTFWRAHLALAHLRRQTPTNSHAHRWQSLLAQHPADRTARSCLHLALAKSWEDLGDYPKAFEHLVQGKAAGREAIDYSIAQDEAIFAAFERAFPIPSAPSNGDPSMEPIFVFGMPRSGTTLVERIISSHPDVSSAGELQNFGMAVRRAWSSPTPFWLDPDLAARMQRIDWRRTGADYLASTRPGTGYTPRFIDKFPFNFLYAGFIATALPNARMICLRRDPLDTCLGNFRQLFAGKLPYYNYSFDLLDCGRYYILFDRLMAHWRRLFPGRILEVQYETLVDDQETVTRQLLDHCDLRWHDACLHFERNAAPVATASTLQVREPMFRSSVGRWRHYKPQLTALRELLRKAGIAEVG